MSMPINHFWGNKKPQYHYGKDNRSFQPHMATTIDLDIHEPMNDLDWQECRMRANTITLMLLQSVQEYILKLI